ncbi:MAG TPA: hypothetical protein VFG10_15210 [Saprospiraceae bacterium]|nr:hypothetical protein [Saprospiraceae bacterium]
MTRIIVLILTVGNFLISGIVTAQVGIGTSTPGTSAILELYSDH